MLYQLEITTHCNYGCFYCAGRDMKQQHMTWDLFERLLAGVPAGDHVVSLQGEGEPTVHPRFWDMVDAVRARGLRPFTITNCSHVDAARFAESFPTFAVSIDTLDPIEAERIGRYKIDRMLKNLDDLCAVIDPNRIHIMTVDYGQPLAAVREFAHTRGFGHTVQPLQAKDDYADRYPERIAARSRAYTYSCRYLDQPLRRYYDVEGREYPCCYIKDHRRHEPIETLRAKMAARQMPAACEGCHEVLAPENIARAHPVAPSAEAPQLSIVMVCDVLSPVLGETLAAMAAQNEAEVIVVQTGGSAVSASGSAWPNVRVLKMRDEQAANLARARNHGARRARGEWLCFVDAGLAPGGRFATEVPGALTANGFICATEPPGLVLCARTDFLAIEGFDELLDGCGQAERDLALRLQLLGRVRRNNVSAAPASSGGQNPRLHDLDPLERMIGTVYMQIKRDLICERGGKTLPQTVRAMIHQKVGDTARGAAAQGRTRTAVNITLPDHLAVQVMPGWQLRRVWSYVIDLPGAAATPGNKL